MADFFSLLPDTLIILIISSLPFKEAARTSLLSKRWRRLFHETKTVDFDETHFVKGSTEEDQSKKDAQRRAFLDFLGDWARNSTTPVLNKLRLAISNPQDSALQVNNCVRFAVGRKAKILELDFSDPSWNEESFENHDALFDLPPFVYEHDTMEFLKLFSCNFLSSGFEKFTSLKSISLGWIELPNSSLRSLLTTCKFLENLSLKKCWGLECMSVSAPRLKSLVIDKCLDLENGVWINSRTKLRVFKYIGLLVNVDIESWRDLEEAYLDYALESNLRDCGDLLYQTLDNVYSVRHLTVCSYMLQEIPSAEDWPTMKPPLQCLKHLTLKTALHPHEYHGISFFLSSCPCLETLTFDMVTSKIFQERATHLSLQEHEFLGNSKYVLVQKWMKSLKEVEVKGFKGGVFEVAVVGFLMACGRGLERLSIVLSKDKGDPSLEDRYRTDAEKLLRFPRASTSLRASII